MWQYNYTDELCHYGVPGMKWGVRRAQKLGGQYSKTGLKVFDKYKKQYDEADKKVKSLKNGDKESYRLAKSERKLAKDKLNKSYKQLKTDVKGDKGRILSQNGKSIFGNKMAAISSQIGVATGANIARNLISSRMGYTKTANIAKNTVTIGAMAINSIIAAKAYTDNKNLRAYYGHSRKIK